MINDDDVEIIISKSDNEIIIPKSKNIESPKNESISVMINKNIKFYKNTYNIIFLYIDELIHAIEDKLFNDEITKDINKKYIMSMVKKLDSYITIFDKKGKLDIEYISNLLKIYKSLKKIETELSNNMKLINQIDIFNQRTLMSDTSKNNINKNKLHILEIYNQHYKNIKSNNTLIIDNLTVLIIDIIKSDNKNYKIIEFMSNYFNKHGIIIDLYISVINEIKLLKSNTINYDKIKYLLINILENNKNIILENELKLLKIKCNTNDKMNIDLESIVTKTVKNKLIKIIKNKNLIKKYNDFKYFKGYKSLKELVIDNLEIENKLTNKLDSTNLKILYKITELYKKKNKKELIILVLDCKSDNINYNISNLLNPKIKIDSNMGINNTYITKTETIEYNENSKHIQNPFISNIDQIYIINAIYDINKLNINQINTNVLLIQSNIQNKNNIFNIFKKNSIVNKNVLYKDIISIIRNEPLYKIENYNNLIETSILKQVQKINIFEEYTDKINQDFKTFTIKNNLEIKYKITNEIKSKIKLKVTNDNKNKIVEHILEIIVSNIAKYIKDNNNIEYNSEIYLTYFSNINSIVNKFKKELVDNYNTDLIINIEKIFDNIYNNILNINNNIIDKYYSSNLFL